MNRPLGLSSLIRLSEYARHQERRELSIKHRITLSMLFQMARNTLAGIGFVCLLIVGWSFTSDEGRPALISEAQLRRTIANERIKAVKEVDDALAEQKKAVPTVPPAGSLRGFFTPLKRKST